MALNPEQKAIIDEELAILDAVLESLRKQANYSKSKFVSEQDKSREMNASIVASYRAEEKAMLASDEAVAHALSQKKQSDLKGIQKLLKRPYFGRIIVAEERPEGTKEIEYKLGLMANPDCRIIDWRSAPISKLYYEYREGDEYEEMILGQERIGKIILRRTLEIEHGVLRSITCPQGSFEKKNSEWQAREGGTRSTRAGAASTLSDVLPLVTPDQFRMITEDAETAILIQGVAGSGKTTVALHRLSWLMQNKEDFSENDALILLFSLPLKKYIQSLLPALDMEGIKVLSFGEWAARSFKTILPDFVEDGEFPKVRRSSDPIPSRIQRMKTSMALLDTLEERARKDTSAELKEIYLSCFDDYEQILGRDETKLLDRALIWEAAERTRMLFKQHALDAADESLLLRLHQIRSGQSQKLKHVIADEVQDYSPAELATIVASVEHPGQLTLVGDVAQSINGEGSFPGWNKLRKRWQLKDSIARTVSLTVSYRSTLPIMRLADRIQHRAPISTGRTGRVPILFKARKEEKGIDSAIKWLSKAVELYPTEMSAVICADRQEARQVLSMLRPRLGNTVRIGDDTDFTFEEGIVVSSAAQVKGLEFANVLLWNPRRETYPNNDLGKNLLYVAITRAIENLCITSWRSLPEILPHPREGLMRLVDLTVEEDQEESAAAHDS